MEYVDLRVEDLGDRRYFFKPEYGHIDSLPGLDPEGMMATFDRTDALNRDDIHFFTPDHPLLRSSLDSLLGSEKGNATLSVYQGAECPEFSCKLPSLWNVLPPPFTYRPLPVHYSNSTLVDHTGEVLDEPSFWLRSIKQSRHRSDPWQLGNQTNHQKHGQIWRSHLYDVTQKMVEDSTITMQQELQSEISRLQNLARLNPSVDQQEIKNLQTHQTAIEEALAETRFRLDSLHLVVVESESSHFMIQSQSSSMSDVEQLWDELNRQPVHRLRIGRIWMSQKLISGSI